MHKPVALHNPALIAAQRAGKLQTGSNLQSQLSKKSNPSSKDAVSNKTSTEAASEHYEEWYVINIYTRVSYCFHPCMYDCLQNVFIKSSKTPELTIVMKTILDIRKLVFWGHWFFGANCNITRIYCVLIYSPVSR